MTRVRKRQAQSGFTLVEILVTMLILSIVFLGLAGIQLSVIRNVGYSKTASEATRLAQSRIEFYQSMSGAAVTTYFTTTPHSSGTWFTVATSVGVDGVSSGPFTLEERGDLVSPAWVVTTRVTWLAVSTSGGAMPRNVMITTRRVP